MATIHIYTDGACSGNPGPGGWAAILICGEITKRISGGYRRTTNNRMELMAVKEALACLKQPGSDVLIHSDSQIVVKPFMSGNAERRVKNGSQTNIDIWKDILTLASRHNVTMEWVKGHDSNELNNECDAMAVDASHNDNKNVDTFYEEQEKKEAEAPLFSSEQMSGEIFTLLCMNFGEDATRHLDAILSNSNLMIVPKPF